MSTVWHFYASDDDRSNGWTNHGFSLQHVCEGVGATADEAWEEALVAGRVPLLIGDDEFVEPDYAIRADQEHKGSWSV